MKSSFGREVAKDLVVALLIGWFGLVIASLGFYAVEQYKAKSPGLLHALIFGTAVVPVMFICYFAMLPIVRKTKRKRMQLVALLTVMGMGMLAT